MPVDGRLALDSTGMDDEMARRLSEVTTFRNLKALEFAYDRLDASRIKRPIESIVSSTT